MATTKSRRTTKTTAKRTTARRSTTPASTNLMARTGRTVRDRPYASATIATGAVALAAGLAGLFFMKKSGKSFGDVADDLSAKGKSVATDAKAKFDELSAKSKTAATEAKAKFGEVRAKVKTEINDTIAKAEDTLQRRRDGIDPDKPQNEIMEEALTLKATGRKSKKPVDPVIEQQSKVGAIAY